MATLGLVTVLYKSDEVLEDFFRSLSIQTYTDYHLYLIDNSPSPATEALIGRLAKQYAIPAYTHIQNDGNYGVAKGNNMGITPALEAGCDYVLLLNNDIEFVNPKLFEEMMERAINHGEDVIIPKIMFYGTRVIQSAGGIFINYKGVSHSVGYKEQDGDPYNEPSYHEYAPTCFMLVSRKVFEKAGITPESLADVFREAMQANKTATYQGDVYGSSEPDHSVRVSAAKAAASLMIDKDPDGGGGGTTLNFNLLGSNQTFVKKVEIKQ